MVALEMILSAPRSFVFANRFRSPAPVNAELRPSDFPPCSKESIINTTATNISKTCKNSIPYSPFLSFYPFIWIYFPIIASHHHFGKQNSPSQPISSRRSSTTWSGKTPKRWISSLLCTPLVTKIVSTPLSVPSRMSVSRLSPIRTTSSLCS